MHHKKAFSLPITLLSPQYVLDCVSAYLAAGNTSLIPSLKPSFSSLAVRKSGEGLAHFLTSDIKGRKTVEKPKLNVGVLGLRTARRTKVPGNTSQL